MADTTDADFLRAVARLLEHYVPGLANHEGEEYNDWGDKLRAIARRIEWTTDRPTDRGMYSAESDDGKLWHAFYAPGDHWAFRRRLGPLPEVPR